jgi:hypothetical protein
MKTNGVLRSIQDLLPGIRSPRQEIGQARRIPRDLIEGLGKKPGASYGAASRTRPSSELS